MATKRIHDPKVLADVRGQPCVVCGKPSDPAHIKSRGAGGDDTHDNVLPLCRSHHIKQHALGWNRFCTMFPRAGIELFRRGWRVVEEFGVWRLRRV